MSFTGYTYLRGRTPTDVVKSMTRRTSKRRRETEMYDDDDVDEITDGEECESAELPNRGVMAKGKLYAGKEKNTDMRANECSVVCNFYKSRDGPVYLALPKLPNVKPDFQVNLPLDYEDFNNKMSSWFEKAEKRMKATVHKPPIPKKKYICTECDWSFETTGKLSRHRCVHDSPGVFACQVCLILFNHSYNMYNHWRSSCNQVSSMKTDAEIAGSDINSLRNYVLCVMGTENRAQQFHCFGGIVYIPSQSFLANTEVVIDPHHSSYCHLCHLTVPNKFLECHGDVHRGRFRIDGRIYGDYYCHICSKIFRMKSNLIMHWRSECTEVIAYTPDDVYLSDEELATIAWLVLQASISRKTINDMARNTNLMLEKWAKEHSKSNGVSINSVQYYHYPQEIWPLKTHTGLDIINDAIPIMGDNAFTIDNPNLPVHAFNILATACPDFYATGMAFTKVCATQKDPNAPKSIYRIILRYTTRGSIINTYKFNSRTNPRLRRGAEYDDFNVDAENSIYCLKCDKSSMISFPSIERSKIHDDRHKGFRSHCEICNLLINNRSYEEHWEYDCIPLQTILENQEDRKYVDKLLAENIYKCMKVVKEKVRIDWLNRPDEPPLTDKQSVDRIGEKYILHYDIDKKKQNRFATLLKIELQLAKKRNIKSRYQENTFVPESSHGLVFCPHCGAKLHYTRLHLHLEQRHFWPSDNEIVRKRMDEWKGRGDFHKTYFMVKDLVKELGQQIMPLMSEIQYNMCVAYDGNLQDITESLDSPWSEKTTTRKVKLNEPLLLLNKNIDKDVLVAPEPNCNWALFYPAVVDASTQTTGDSESVPLANEIDTCPAVPCDPMTGAVLPERFRQIQIEQDEHFFGDFHQDALATGINIHSITDFFKIPEKDRSASRMENEDDEFDRINSDEERDDLTWQEHDYENEIYTMDTDGDDESDSESDVVVVEGDEDQEEASESRADEESSDDDEESKEAMNRRAIKRREERTKHRNISKQATLPGPYIPQNFAPLNIALDPSKFSQLKYLSGVAEDDKPSENDNNMENNQPLALSLDYENVLSDFRISAVKFRKRYKNDLAVNRRGDATKYLTQNQRKAAIQYNHLNPSPNDPPGTVYDDQGHVFVGGFILPMDDTHDNLKTSYIVQGDYAKKYTTYHCNDDEGQFKFLWPTDDETSDIQNKFSSLKRAKLTLQPQDYDSYEKHMDRQTPRGKSETLGSREDKGTRSNGNVLSMNDSTDDDYNSTGFYNEEDDDNQPCTSASMYRKR